jgi:hypothetical protein
METESEIRPGRPELKLDFGSPDAAAQQFNFFIK